MCADLRYSDVENALGLVLLVCLVVVAVRIAGWARRSESGVGSGQQTDDEQSLSDELSKARQAADELHETYEWADPERLPLDEQFQRRG